MKPSPRNPAAVPRTPVLNAAPGSLDLAQTQRLMAAMIMRPLTVDQRTERRWIDDQPADTVAQIILKPNDRLTAIERLEIYNRQYWFRLLDALYDDFPGLRTLLGNDRFYDLSVAYLERHPSQSFTLRNLGSRLEMYLRENPRWTRPRTKLVLDMARFEWAQIESFDAAAWPPLTPDDLLGQDPATLRLNLQPHVVPLALSYPLDDFLMTVKREQHGEASNAAPESPEFPAPESSGMGPGAGAGVRPGVLPPRKKTYLAIHRVDNSLYFKPLDPRGYKILISLQSGQTLQDSVAAAFDPAPRSWSAEKITTHVQRWFQNWMTIGWFCQPSRDDSA